MSEHDSKPSQDSRQGLAPSERHLEDYIWANPDDLAPDLAHNEQPFFKLIDRQVTLPSGIVDLLGFDYRMLVFELKKGTLKAAALTQILRYMREMQDIARLALHQMGYDDRLRPWVNGLFTGSTFDITEVLGGVLVGHSYEDENFIIACEACNVEVILYDYADGQYEFSMITTDRFSCERHDQIMPYADGPIGQAFKDWFIPGALNHYERHHQAPYSVVEAATQIADKLFSGGAA